MPTLKPVSAREIPPPPPPPPPMPGTVPPAPPMLGLVKPSSVASPKRKAMVENIKKAARTTRPDWHQCMQEIRVSKNLSYLWSPQLCEDKI